MAYCTVADMIAIFGEDDIAALANRSSGMPSFVNVPVVVDALARAEAEVNIYVEGHYRLPLASTPLILKQATADIARFFMYTRIDEDHPAAQCFQRRVKQLEGIAAGRLSLGLDAANQAATPADTVQIAPGRNDFGGRNW